MGALPGITAVLAIAFLPPLSTRSWTSLSISSSIVLRVATYIHLRWITGRFWVFLPLMFGLYLLAWCKLDWRLDYLERMMGKGGGGVIARCQRMPRLDKKLISGPVMSNKRTGKSKTLLVNGHGASRRDVKCKTPTYDTPCNGELTYAAVAAKQPHSSGSYVSPDSQVESGDVKIGDSKHSNGVPCIPASFNGIESIAISEPVRGPPLPYLASLIKPPMADRRWALPTGALTPSRVFNRFSLLINFLCVLACFDAVFRPVFFNGSHNLSFSRIGAVGENWVKVHARVPPTKVWDWVSSVDSKVLGMSKQVAGWKDEIGARIIYRPTKPVGKWFLGPEFNVSQETDWNGVVKLDGLWPATEYEYRLTKVDSPSVEHPSFPNVGHFKTFPDSRLAVARGGGSVFTFGTGSCMTTGFPYNPFRSALTNDGAETLAKHIRKQPLEFFLFLGDFIYADVPFYAGKAVKHYLRKYRQMYAGEAWRQVAATTPTFHIYDDHEIVNDYSAKYGTEVFGSANVAYRAYQGDANYDGPGGDANYYWFRHGDAAFFVLDTRRYRSHNKGVDDHTKTMLGARQKAEFFEWLAAVNHTVTFKFVVSSVPLMSLWHGPVLTAMDTWAGFMTERSELLDVMEYVPNVVILSGDRHEFASSIMRESVLELSTSPLNQFWIPVKTVSPTNAAGASGEDRLIKYIPEGNHKFTTVSVDTRVENSPQLLFQMWSDGDLAWNLTYVGQPVREAPRQIGSVLPTLAEWLGFKPRKWFKQYVINEELYNKR